MSNTLRQRLGILVLTLFFVPAAAAQVSEDDIGTDKLAQTSFKFLEVSADARAAGMADALTAADLHSSVAMFYNPAGMARLENNFSAAFGMTEWIAGIKYNAASAAYSPMNGRYGVFGLSLMFADYGDDFIGTVKSGDGYQDYSELGLANPEPTAMAIGLGYAIGLTDRFSVGANAKYVSQDLGDALVSLEGGNTVESNEVSTIAFDFGVLYKTGFESLNFAMSVRNFAKELKYVDETFELPLTFNVGVEMDLMDLTSMDRNMHSFRVAVEAERPRDFDEQLKFGGEYTFMNILSLRGGYAFPSDEQGVSLGAGLKYAISNIGIGVDYAYTSFGVFNKAQRFGVHLSF